MGRTVALLVLSALLAGCVGLRDRRDAPWDPRPEQGSLLDQIPNEEGAAGRRCGGHLREEDRGGRSPRC